MAPDDVKKLAYGEGAGLKVLLALLRYARPYSLTPISGGDRKRLFNATERMSIADLSKSAVNPKKYQDDAVQAEGAVRRGVLALQQLHFVEVIEDPGHPSFYAPHALLGSVRVPQHLWRGRWLSRLNGAAVSLLVALLARAHLPDVCLGFVQDRDAVLGSLPFSPNTRNRALAALEEAGLVRQLETRGRRLIVLIEPA